MQIFIKTLTGRKTNFNFELDFGKRDGRRAWLKILENGCLLNTRLLGIMCCCALFVLVCIVCTVCVVCIVCMVCIVPYCEL